MINKGISSVDYWKIAEMLGLRRRGSRFYCVCQNNKGQTPDLSIDRNDGRLNCFKCSLSGNIYSLIMKCRSCSFREAQEWLETTANTGELLTINTTNAWNKKDRLKGDLTQKLKQEIYREFLNYCQPITGGNASKFLNKKMISIETVERLSVKCLAPADYAYNFKHLCLKFGVENLIKAKLAGCDNDCRKAWPVGLSYYRRKIDIIVFPYFWQDEILGFKIRPAITKDEAEKLKCSRFLNVGNCKIYNLNALYNPYEVFICEGETDCLSIEQMGFNAIGLAGTGNVGELEKYIDFFKSEIIENGEIVKNREVIDCLDSDTAGEKATVELKALFVKCGLSEPLKLNFETDVNDFIKNAINEKTADSIKCEKRVDGGGDVWANNHRTKLNGTYQMSDIDSFGIIKSDDEFFVEYEKSGNNMAVVALFDRKLSNYENEKTMNRRCFYNYIAQCIGKCQSIMPKVYEVVGKEKPFQMFEIDINTCKRINDPVILGKEDSWEPIWDSLGLTQIRKQLKRELINENNNT